MRLAAMCVLQLFRQSVNELRIFTLVSFVWRLNSPKKYEVMNMMMIDEEHKVLETF